VLACLEKDANDRPQTAAKLRRRLEACRVEPWDNDQALSWWSAHDTALENDAAHSTGEPRTIAVDGARRSSPGARRRRAPAALTGMTGCVAAPGAGEGVNNTLALVITK